MTAEAYSEDAGDQLSADRVTVGDEHIIVRLPNTWTHLWELDLTKGLPAATPGELLLKRALDVVVASLAILFSIPVMVVLALGVKLSSPGPVMYWSNRVGKGGSIIRIPKFRSMFVDAEQRLASLVSLNEASGPVFKIKEDPRITPFGRIMRKLSLDELPQLWNVLRGDMSLVGPRPALPNEVSTYGELERQRLLVKPGLTCIWQVSGRSDLDFETWMQMDLKYIGEWSIAKDLVLLARTPLAVGLGRGAY